MRSQTNKQTPARARVDNSNRSFTNTPFFLSADVVNAILRCRLYAYSRGQRTNVLGEGNLELSQINTRIENSLTIPLAPVIEKQGGSSVNLSESEDEVSKLPYQLDKYKPGIILLIFSISA